MTHSLERPCSIRRTSKKSILSGTTRLSLQSCNKSRICSQRRSVTTCYTASIAEVSPTSRLSFVCERLFSRQAAVSSTIRSSSRSAWRPKSAKGEPGCLEARSSASRLLEPLFASQEYYSWMKQLLLSTLRVSTRSKLPWTLSLSRRPSLWL